MMKVSRADRVLFVATVDSILAAKTSDAWCSWLYVREIRVLPSAPRWSIARASGFPKV